MHEKRLARLRALQAQRIALHEATKAGMDAIVAAKQLEIDNLEAQLRPRLLRVV